MISTQANLAPSPLPANKKLVWGIAFALYTLGMVLLAIAVLGIAIYRHGSHVWLFALESWGLVALGMTVALFVSAWGSTTTQAANWALFAMLPRMLPPLVGLVVLPMMSPDWKSHGGGDALLMSYLLALVLEISISVRFFVPVPARVNASVLPPVEHSTASPLSREA